MTTRNINPEQFKKNQADVEEGIHRAMVQRAKMGPEAAAAGDALTASAPDRFKRMFVSPPNAKGRQDMHIATPEELQEWRTKQ